MAKLAPVDQTGQYVIPLRGDRRFVFELDSDDLLTADEWRRVQMVLELFRPGLVADDPEPEPEPGTTPDTTTTDVPVVTDVPAPTDPSLVPDPSAVTPESDDRGD